MAVETNQLTPIYIHTSYQNLKPANRWVTLLVTFLSLLITKISALYERVECFQAVRLKGHLCVFTEGQVIAVDLARLFFDLQPRFRLLLNPPDSRPARSNHQLDLVRWDLRYAHQIHTMESQIFTRTLR